MPKPLRAVGKMWYDAPCTHGGSAGRGVWKYDAGGGTGGAGLDSGPSALRFSGHGDAVDQPDLRPRGDLDPAGGGAAAPAEAPLDRGGPVLCADSGSDLLQYPSETPDRPGPALLGEHRGGAADGAPGRRLLPLRAHGGVLRGGVRPPASGSPLWKPALVLAAGIAFSRLYLYVHWPTDVLGAFWWAP